MEHHANLVPWIRLQETLGITLRYIPMNMEGYLEMTTIDALFTSEVKLVSLAFISNALGTIHPIDEIIKRAKSIGALVHLDAAQAIAHRPIDVQKLDIDFMSFSSHKMYGPMGLGVFWGKEIHLKDMNPFLFGGEMIKEVYLDRVTYNDLPYKFEAGTPNVADVVGLGAALAFIQTLGWQDIEEKEQSMYNYLYNALMAIPNIILFSPKDKSIGAISFGIKDIHPYDIGQMLDLQGIAIRTGHHCCQPLMRKLGIEGTCRVSLAIYNTKEEIDFFVLQLSKIIPLLT